MSRNWEAIYRINRTIAICLLFLTGLAVLLTLHFGKPFLAPTVVGLLIALTLSPLVRSLEGRGLSSEISSAVVVVGVVLALATTCYVLFPSYEVWRERMPEIAQSLKERFAEVEEQLEQVSETAEAVQEVAQEAAGVDKKGAAASEPSSNAAAAATGGPIVLQLLSEAPAFAATVLYVTLLAFFVMAERARLHRALVGALNSVRRRRHLARALRDMRRSVSRYLLLITIINIGLGAVAAVVFFLLGLPNAALWGAAMTLLNFVPYLGPAIMSVVILLVGLISYDSVQMALAPVAALLVLNMIEGQIVTPMIVGRQMLQSSLAVFVAVAFGAWLWGAVGALIATPVLIVGRIWFERFQLLPTRRSAPVETRSAAAPVARVSGASP